MTEKELIGKIRLLGQIKPQKEWVVLTKGRILGEEPAFKERFSFNFFPFLKPAYASVIIVFLFLGLFGIYNSLPGDLLYSVKKIAQKSQAVFVSEDEKPAFQLRLANERLEDLTKAQVKNLAPTINEFQATVSAAAKNITKIDATTSDLGVIKKIVVETKKLEENKQKMESLGMVLEGKGTEELDNALAKMVNSLIEDLENRSLTEDKEEILAEMKELAEEEKYSEALELYLVNQ